MNRAATGVQRLRCAIYTRVSSDAGLEQEFNSLDNQREASEAYIRSQSHEGWSLMPDRFDDGGWSGGSLGRPALQQLLEAVQARRIDVIVVYKVDRLTRSLADFAKLVELFDMHGVSFVSVTQAFNTTTSMGRLTLNVLLSFAQFEREVTAERIRDKVAASKRKGIWMGGPVPLGYRVLDQKLVPDEVEASHIRTIFEGYLACGSLSGLMAALDEQGIVTKRSVRRNGTIRGGIRFGKGTLHYLLQNRIYVGELKHKSQWHKGEHQALIDREMFDAVQACLVRTGTTRRRLQHDMFLLQERIFDDAGNRLMPRLARKGGVHYRYYVSAPVAQERQGKTVRRLRVPASEIEDVVLGALREQTGNFLIPTDYDNIRAEETGSVDSALCDQIAKVVVFNDALRVEAVGNRPNVPPLTIPWIKKPLRRRRELIAVDGGGDTLRPIRAETRARLLLTIAKTRRWVDDLIAGQVHSLADIAEAENCSERSVRQRLNLAFLPPEIIKAAINGTLPDGFSVSSMMSGSKLSMEQLYRKE